MVKHLKVLENHISTNEQNTFVYRNGASPTSEQTNPSTPSSWQAIAPPISKSTDPIPSPWDGPHQFTVAYSEDREYSPKSASIPSSVNKYDSDDHHTSFEYNGRIVHEIEEPNKSNIPLYFHTLPSVTNHLIEPGMPKPGRERSGSLDIQAKGAPPKGEMKEKGRSFSLSSFGDLSTWDEQKPALPQRHYVGMSNIAPWLKSLRLHKYAFLFSYQTYEQMMETTEEHLMNVTKGARHKLVTNIQKLKDRYMVLSQMEQDLLCGQITIAKALEELSTLVITPMKPIEPFDKQDVPTQLLKVLDLGEFFV